MRFHSTSFYGEELHDKYKVYYRLCTSIEWKLKDQKIVSPILYYIDYHSKGKTEIKKIENYISKDKQFQNCEISVKEIKSDVLNCLQIADFLTGCMSYKINARLKHCRTHPQKEAFVRELEKLDKKFDLDESSTNKYQKWDYLECKIQHYNLHLRDIPKAIKI